MQLGKYEINIGVQAWNLKSCKLRFLYPHKLCFKTALLLCLVTYILIGCTPSDPIDRLVKEESSDPMFGNGMYFPITLPETTPPNQIAAMALNDTLTNLVVLKIKNVIISYGKEQDMMPETTRYTAVLVGTRDGVKIVLAQYRSDKPVVGWWTRVYDVK